MPVWYPGKGGGPWAWPSGPESWGTKRGQRQRGRFRGERREGRPLCPVGRGHQGGCGVQMTALRLRVNLDTWCDRSPSWHSLLLVPVSCPSGPSDRAWRGGQGVPEGWTLPTPCPRKSPWRRGSICFKWLPSWFWTRSSCFDSCAWSRWCHLTDGEGHVPRTLSKGPQRSRVKGLGFWCLTLSPHLRPTTGLPSTEMGTRTLGEQSLPWTLPVFG